MTAGRTAAEINADRDRRDALLWNFTVLGEAAGRVSDETKTAHDEVAWTDPVRLRNRIVHGYWSVSLAVLVDTAREDLPGLIGDLTRVSAALTD